MDEITKNDLPTKYYDCHSVAHVIGAETYRQYGDVEQAVMQCTNGCFDGCLHGVMGAAVQAAYGESDPGIDIVHMDVAQIESIGKKYCSNYGLCHGIGHVLYTVLNNFSKASDACSTISGGIAEENCTAGVFMQGVGVIGDALVLATSSLSAAKVPPGDYAYPCNTIDVRFQHSCFSYLGPYQMLAFKAAGIQDYSRQIELQIGVCKSLPSISRSYCFEGLGKYSRNYGPATGTSSIAGRTAYFCEGLPSDPDKRSCVLGRISVLHGYRDYKGANDICTALGPKDLRTFCYLATFVYFGPQSVPGVQGMCPDASDTLCSETFATYQKIRATLPDYRFGLYGEKS